MADSVARLESLVPREVWQALLANGSARRYDHGEVLMRQGDPGSYVVLITAGHAKVTRVDPEGNEHLLVIRGPGEVVGEISVLDGSVRSATVTALAPCITYVLASGRFLRIVREHRVEDILLRYVIARFRESEDVRAELAMLPAVHRIARVLLRFAAVVGGEQPELDLSQDELAGATGLSRASVAAKLAALRHRGVVVTGRRSLIVRDLAGLRGTSGY